MFCIDLNNSKNIFLWDNELKMYADIKKMIRIKILSNIL